MIRSVGLLLRLAGSDAPEHDQPCGQRSRLSLAELAFKSVGETVRSGGGCGALRGETYLRRDDPRGKRRVLSQAVWGLSRLDGDLDGTP